MKYFRLLILTLLFLTSCSEKQAELTPTVAPPPDQVDFSCSSFYFLWGTHAEYSEHYSEALEAYEKALICDPSATYIKEKLPILMLKMGDFDTAAAWLTAAIEEEPENTTYLLFLANIYVQQERIQEAVNLYAAILTLEPDNEPVNTRLGILYTHLGDYDTAETIFRDLLKHNPNSYFTALSLARLLNQNHEYNESSELYEKALSLNWSKELAFEIGYLYSSRNEYDNALRIFTTITDNDRFDERAWLSRIQSLLDLERLKEADEQLQQVRLFSEQPEKIDIIISKVYLQQERTDEALVILQQLEINPEAYEARYMLALLAYQQGNYLDSLSYVDRIAPSSSMYEEAVYLKVKIYGKQQKTADAITLLTKNLQTEETSSPLFYALLSSIYLDDNRKELALTTLEEGTRIFSKNHQLHFELGLLLERSGRTNEAIVEMQKVLELQPNHADALNFIGYSWADQNHNLDEALTYILQAIELKPENGFIIDSLGWVYFRMGRFEDAVEALLHAVELQPNDPHIFEHLGDAYGALGENTKATYAYEKAYELFEDKDKKTVVKEKIDATRKK
ncbi:tetratricopeptide repeat protein [Desulforhopalus sp. 52FAK]